MIAVIRTAITNLEILKLDGAKIPDVKNMEVEREVIGSPGFQGP